MKILFFGDIVGRLGLEAVASLLPKLAKEYDADFIIANGENVSKGRGITESDWMVMASSVSACSERFSLNRLRSSSSSRVMGKLTT